MTNKNKRIKEYIRDRDQGVCQCCGKYCWNTGNTAHRIAETKTNIKVYGREIIDHPYNKVWTCFSFTCNDSFNIGFKKYKPGLLITLMSTKGYSAKEITSLLKNY